MNRRAFLSVVKAGLLGAAAAAVLGGDALTPRAEAGVDIDIFINHWKHKRKKRKHRRRPNRK